MRITQKAIADACGLSIQAVNFILNGKGERFRPETRELVWSTATRLGYRLNSSARAMKTGRFNAIAAVFGIGLNPLAIPSPMLDGMERCLNRRSMHLSIGRFSENMFTNNEPLPKLLSEWSVDGLLVKDMNALGPHLQQIINSWNLPHVWINEKMTTNAVYSDDFGAAYEATRRLIELGHRRLTYISYSHDLAVPNLHYSVYDRRAGFETAMAEARLTPLEVMTQGKVERDQRLSASRRWLSQNGRPTAVLAYGESTAYPIVLAATQLQLPIPRDLSIVSFGDNSGDSIGIELAKMVNPVRKTGEMATEMLLDLIDGGAPQPATVLPLSFTPGQTCLPPTGETPTDLPPQQ